MGEDELDQERVQVIHDKGYTGLLGMEHGKSLPGRKGELALIKAYRDADDFGKARRA